MKKPQSEFPPKEALLSAEETAKLIISLADRNYTLGLKKGYVRGRQDEREGKPWPPSIEKPQ